MPKPAEARHDLGANLAQPSLVYKLCCVDPQAMDEAQTWPVRLVIVPGRPVA